jgi:Flp pilus assembly protein TadD
LLVDAALRLPAVLALCLGLIACSGLSSSARPVSQLPPLELEDGQLTLAEARTMAPTPDLLGVDQEMLDFLDRYVEYKASARQRLRNLHRALVGAGALNVDYDPAADGSASDTFHRGSANCLSYANLFIALAREVDLDARYQWQEVRPQWTRLGERVAVQLHVNISVKTRHGGHYVVDLDPLPRTQLAGIHELPDADRRALYHNNLAMKALAEEELALAWAHGVKALTFSPEMAHLWVNLGAVYRRAGQNRAAESNYLHALALDSQERSAMNNLVVLYGLEGNEEAQDYWVSQVQRYRDANPFYHAYLGDKAGQLGDWREALMHYEEALQLLPEESSLLYATGLIHYELRNLDEAARYLQQAIDNAVLYSDQTIYRQRLEAMQNESLAQL